MTPEPDFALTDYERNSPLWLRLKTEFEKRIATRQRKLEGNQTELETAISRGHIQCLRSILRLGESPPEFDGQ